MGYLDKAMKKSEGRKLGTQYCVENPSIKELFVICKNFNLETVAEDKHHPKDWMKRGRVVIKVEKDLNDNPFNDIFKNKNDFLKLCGGELIKIKEKIVQKALEAPTSEK